MLLSTLTASNSANLQDTTNITSTYHTYEIRFENVIPATNAVTLMIRVQSGGSFQTTSYASNGIYSNTAGVAGLGAGTTGIPMGFASRLSNTTANGGFSGTVTLANPSQTSSYKHFFGNGSMVDSAGNGESLVTISGSWQGGTGAITGIQVLMSSGNITSGKIRIYGYP